MLMVLLFGTPLMAEDNSIYLHGEVETFENTYKGYIRWGKEEVFCFDYFNASKLETQYNKEYLKSVENQNTSWLDDIDWDISSIWEDKRSSLRHEFNCEFGDIRSVEVLGENKVKLRLKNGVLLKVGGSGYNDIGTTINIIDEDLGEVKLRWNKIKRITFSSLRDRQGPTFGKPIYGKVNTYRKGSFTGYVQWDRDERVHQDLLDGKSRDGEVAIAFGKISKIEKGRNGSKVSLNSGREFYLTGSNDVNGGNRGVVVYVDGVGEIIVPWKSFLSLDIVEEKDKAMDVSQYKNIKQMEGKVFLYDNSSVSGKIIYDLDETWQFETLEGEDDHIKYRIPFKNIKSIKPKNYDYSLVTLKNNESFLLGRLRDVSDDNDGLLVISRSNTEPKFVAWDEISEIVFN